MQKYFSILSFFLVPLFSMAFQPRQNTDYYQVLIDLNQINDKKITIQVVVPKINEQEAIFNMPKIVPGTYKIYNFGQFLHNVKAFTQSGTELKVEQLNDNQWKISNAKNLYKLQYEADGSYQRKGSKIFAPAGTSVTKDAFLLNNFGFIGYLEGYKNKAFEVEIRRPSSLYGTTSLPLIRRTEESDFYRADDYFHLHDCPMLYAKPDTASAIVVGMPVRIGVYSPQGNIKAREIRDALVPVFQAAAAYLGDTLPAKEYVIIIYGLTLAKAASGTGALEHHTSTVFNMPDVDLKMLEMFTGEEGMQMYRDVVAHEFFHIVTPLNIHAQQINDFDFINPQMSEHLWLYEGVTEYNSMIAQVRGGVMGMDQFLAEVTEKMQTSRSYDPHLPFTQTSRYALSFFENQYLNVYQKGALIGMATDLKLRILSNGKTGLIDVLRKLWTIYGPDTFFVDDQLFRQIAEVSGYPEMEEFLVRHIAGTQPLPFEALLKEVGIDYSESVKEDQIAFGKMQIDYTRDKGEIFVANLNSEDPFTREMKVQKGDILLSWNGKKLNRETLEPVFQDYVNTARAGDALVIEVKREVKPGSMKKIKLIGKTTTNTVEEFDVIQLDEAATPQQLNLRKAWLNQ